MREYAFTFPLEGGLHARPAAVLREKALASGVPCELVNDRTGAHAKLSNLLSLLATDTRRGDPCRLLAEGHGADKALQELGAFLAGAFLASDTQEQPQVGSTGTAIPRILARAGCAFREGTPVAPGVGTGPAVLARPTWAEIPTTPSEDPAVERALLRLALLRVRGALRTEAQGAGHPAQRAVLEAQAAILQDEDWLQALEEAVASGLRAPGAVVRSLEAAQAGLRASTNPYLQERALDLRDLGDRLLAELTGADPFRLRLPGPCVVVATDLTPSCLLSLDRSLVKGLVLAGGAATSHTAILARSFGIPCVVCPGDLRAAPGQRLTVDGDRGLVIPDPPPALDAYYAIEARERARVAPEGGPAAVAAVALHANILSALEAPHAFQCGAEGIGLFRSEMLFLDRPEPPDETEQYEAYRRVLEAAQGRPVVLRLLDVGGDKPLPYLPLPREDNPFLGRRGVRWYEHHPALVKTQVRAAVRAARHGDLRLMIPMVAQVEEIRSVRALMEGAELPLGIMVEVPAAALNLAALSRETDFLCVGTNDLVQYLFAADRGDAAVARPSNDWHPATLRLLDLVVREAQRPLSLCGEMAGKPSLLPLLVGLGFRTLSMAPAMLPAARRVLATLDAGQCRSLVEAAMAAGTAEEVGRLLRDRPGSRGGSLVHPDLVLPDGAAATKEEAIKLLAERVAAQGRARDPLALEEAIWAREAAYATGVGFGFAVPHCKSADVETPSLAVLRLPFPIAWGSLDGQPVDFIFLLASGRDGGGQEHLHVFARLARKLMDETFRAQLRQAEGAASILAILQTHVLPDL